MAENSLLIILGPTASGKTKLAVDLAYDLNGELISADSRQVFKDMNIGTGKDLEDFSSRERAIPYHLINIREAGDHYNVDAFKNDFFTAFQDIQEREKLPILCGGTGMYINALLQNHQLTSIPPNENLRTTLQNCSRTELIDHLNTFPEEFRAKVDYSSTKRIIRGIEIAHFLNQNPLPETSFPPLSPLVIGLRNDLGIQRSKILKRLDDRLKNGLIEEVEQLIKNGVSKEKLIFYGLEYKFVVSYINKEITFADLQERLGIAICQFAKRQMTFFRKMEKDGVVIHWIDALENSEILKEQVIQLLRNKSESN